MSSASRILRAMYPMQRPRQLTRMAESLKRFLGVAMPMSAMSNYGEPLAIEHWWVMEPSKTAHTEAHPVSGGEYSIVGSVMQPASKGGPRIIITSTVVKASQAGIVTTDTGQEYRLGEISHLSRFGKAETIESLINSLRK